MVSMTGISTKDSSSKKLKLAISFKGTVDDRKVVFELYQKPTNFDGTINLFKTIFEQNLFVRNNVEKYSSLTPREKETLKFIVKGYTNEQISSKMNISHNTIRTHRNRIWKKLKIQHLRDCLKFELFSN